MKKTNQRIDSKTPYVSKPGREIDWRAMRDESRRRVAMVLSVAIGVAATLGLTCCSI